MTIKCPACQHENEQFKIESKTTEKDIEDRRMVFSISIRPYPGAAFCEKCGIFMNEELLVSLFAEKSAAKN